MIPVLSPDILIVPLHSHYIPIIPVLSHYIPIIPYFLITFSLPPPLSLHSYYLLPFPIASHEEGVWDLRHPPILCRCPRSGRFIIDMGKYSVPTSHPASLS